MSKLDDTIKNINKQYKFNIVGTSAVKKKNFARIPFASPAFTYLFKGGMPRTVIELLGVPSSGKSILSYSMIGQAQKQFQKEYDEEVDKLESLAKTTKEEKERLQYLKDRGVMRCVLLDAEFSSDEEWLTKLGVDVDNLIYVAPENQSAEQLFQILLDLMDSGGVGLVVLDSIPMLVSKQAMDKTMEEKTYAGISAALTTFCAKMAPIVKKYSITFIGVNQTRQDLSGYNRVISTGGQAWKHACFIRLLLKKDSYYDSSYNKLNAHPDVFYGHYSLIECLKNKTGDPTRTISRFSITPSKGIDSKNDTINLAIAQGLLVRSGAWYAIEDESGNAKIDNEGNTLKWQGLANVIKFMEEHENVFKELEEAVNTIITK
jgi:recombination protein RecA|nr:MAG TPA: Protein recA [Caudoviricetes sp.]